ncbi:MULTISPECIES: chromate transporter [Eubacteriales]|uniref:Chromate transporter n=2 Tax=Clostridia TaxID=186801 RepID=A0ABW9WRN5_9FIRM|nr:MULTISPECIES: chromate transporter [Eubacteriales]ERJ00144.1 chromate transport protein [Clostridium sp. ATCC 29733]MZL68444.1 chromate transporter [Bittarella massiliensis (ex Durand et al. 2017)]MZL79501.1 chromate transporter [Bittarella massiliensis (ex Durand et al. 2017)]
MQLAKRDLRFYWKLFSSTFTLSAFTFGGGYVIIPLMRKKFVQQYHWLEEDEMLDLTAIAQSSPGPIAVNAAIIIGYRLAGMLGALVAIAGTVLPPLIILSVISLFYQAFRANQVVANVLRGMQAGVAAVIVDVTVTMGWGVAKEKNLLSILMMAAAFVATYVFNVNVAFIVLACGLIGFLCFRQKKSGEVSK